VSLVAEHPVTLRRITAFRGAESVERKDAMTIDERLESLARSIERLGQKTDERLGELAESGKRIDARLDRLAERQEALAESVEMLVLSQRKTDREIRRLGRFVRTIIVDHESRLLDPEGREDDEEDASGDGAGS
jgi:hypothetical protein